MNDLWQFDFKQGRWYQVIANSIVPQARSNHTIISYKDEYYLFGGGGLNRARFGDSWKYRVENNKWQQLQCNGDIPMARTYHAACQGNQYMFIYGGECLDDLDSFYALNLHTLQWQQLTHGAQTRRFASLNYIEIHGQPYVALLGGCLASYLPTSQIYLAKIEYHQNQLNASWIKLSEKFSRWGHSSQIKNNTIWIFGGRNKEDTTDLVQIGLNFNLQCTIYVIKTDNLIKSRRKHVANIVGNSMVVFGGFNGSYHQDLQFIELPFAFFDNNLQQGGDIMKCIEKDQKGRDLVLIQQENQIWLHKFVIQQFGIQLNCEGSQLMLEIKESNRINIDKKIEFQQLQKFVRYLYNNRIEEKDIQQIKNVINQLMDVEIDDNLLFHPWYKSNKDITKVINNKAVQQTFYPNIDAILNNNYPDMHKELLSQLVSNNSQSNLLLLSLVQPWLSYSDFIILTNDNLQFPINKVILNTQSHFFHSLLESNFLESDSHILQLQEINANLFLPVYIYLYTGKILMDESDSYLFEMIQLAKYLDIPGLIQSLEYLIYRSMNHMNHKQYLRQASNINSPKLESVLQFKAIEFQTASTLLKDKQNSFVKERLLYILYKKYSISMQKENIKK